MAPYFETVKSFADVPIREDGIDTAAFLEASDGLMNMFDLLGSGVFGFIQNDVRGNISGVRDRYEATKENSSTLERLVEGEPHGYSTGCMVRLTRGLWLTCEALQELQRDRNAELHVCFKRSYDKVLRRHHSFVIRSVVTVAIRAVPRRNDFYMKIAQGGDIEKLDRELAKWLEGLEAVVQRMKDFLEHGGYGSV